MTVLNTLTLELLKGLVDLHYRPSFNQAVKRAPINAKAIPGILQLKEPLESTGALVKELMCQFTDNYKYAFDSDGDVHTHSTSFMQCPGYVRVQMWRDEKGRVEYRVVRDLVWEPGNHPAEIKPGSRPVGHFLEKLEKWHDLGYSVGAVEKELEGSFALSRQASDCWKGALYVGKSRALKMPKRDVQLEFDLLDCIGSTYVRARAYMKNK